MELWSCGVRELGSCKVGELRSLGVVVCGSCNVGEWYCGRDVLFGGYSGYETLIYSVLNIWSCFEHKV